MATSSGTLYQPFTSHVILTGERDKMHLDGHNGNAKQVTDRLNRLINLGIFFSGREYKNCIPTEAIVF